jgi:hypothetical protein
MVRLIAPYARPRCSRRTGGNGPWSVRWTGVGRHFLGLTTTISRYRTCEIIASSISNLRPGQPNAIDADKEKVPVSVPSEGMPS